LKLTSYRLDTAPRFSGRSKQQVAGEADVVAGAGAHRLFSSTRVLEKKSEMHG
jgi:hypothetical protein